MKRIGFATCAEWPGLTDDDRRAAAALEARGAMVLPVIWTETATPHVDVMVVRSTWGYHLRVLEFARWLDRLEAAGIEVWNPTEVLRWNLNKMYLRDLEEAGVRIAPTEWIAGKAPHLSNLLEEKGWAAAVVKPVISASGYRTFLTTRETAAADGNKYHESLSTGPVMVQPFLDEIVSEGEWSLVFIGGVYSHAVLKRPTAGGFLVQNEFGGSSVPADPPPRLVDDAATALGAAPDRTLYARVDGVRSGDRLVLLELELLEPDLFFRYGPGSAERFAATILGP